MKNTTNTFVYTPSLTFPKALRAYRESAGLSIRGACRAINVSYAYLARLETGGPASVPSLELLFKMADTYRVDRDEILIASGIRTKLPDHVDISEHLDQRFSAVVLSDELCPALLDENAIHYLGDRTKRQWLEFAQKLVDSPDPKALLARLLAPGSANG